MKALPLLVLILLAAAAPAQPSTDSSFGTWPFLVGNMDSRVTQMVNDAVNNNLDTIYVSTFRATGPLTGTLWITDSARTWNSGWGPVRPNGVGIDLTSVVSAAHARNLQVVAVLKCFDSTVQPTDAAHRSYLLSVINYLVNSYDAAGKPVYDIDGVALDYVRFVGGTNNTPAPVTQFVSDVKKKLGLLTLHAYLIANRYTFDGPVYDLNFKSYSTVINGLARQFGQHWEQMARHVDVMMPMAYTADGNIYSGYAAHQAYVQTAASYARLSCQRAGVPNRRVVPAIKTYSDSSETTTTQTIDASIVGAMSGGGNGFNAFRYGTIQSGWWPTLRARIALGPNRPVPSFWASAAGLGVTLNAWASRDFEDPTANLRVRFDWENDGTLDTSAAMPAPFIWVARHPGTWRIGMEVRDTSGLAGYTTRLVRTPDVLSVTPGTLSAATGGAAKLQLDSGPGTAGLFYVLAGSFAGTSPGTSFGPGFTLPLNFDAITILLVTLGNSPLFAGSMGSLDPSGKAAATLSVTPGLMTPFIGATLHFGGVAMSSSTVAYVTNATALRITP